MQDLQIKKEKLLEILKQNKEKHQNNFLIAVDNWKKEYKERLEDLLKQVSEGSFPKNPESALRDLSKPLSYTNTYEEAITMLELDERDVLTLSNREYRQYVLDKWDWSSDFEVSVSKYIK